MIKNKIILTFFIFFLLIIILISSVLAENVTLKDSTKTEQDLKKFSDSSGSDKEKLWKSDIDSNGDKIYRNDLVYGIVKDIFQKQITDLKSSATLAALGQTAGGMFYNNLKNKDVTEIGGVKLNSISDLSKLPDIAKKAGYDVSGVLRPQLESLTGFGSKDLKWSEKGKSIIGNGDVFVNLEKLPYGVTKLNYDEKSKSFTLEFKGGGKLVLGKGATDENGNIKVFSKLSEKSDFRKLLMIFRDPKVPLGLEDFTLISPGKEGSITLDETGLKITGDGTRIKYGEFIFGRKVGEAGESSVVFEENNIRVKNTEVLKVGYLRVGAQSEETIIGAGDPNGFKGKNFVLINGENLNVGGKGRVEVLKDLQSLVAYDTDKDSKFVVKAGQVNLGFYGSRASISNDATKIPIKIKDVSVMNNDVSSFTYTLDPNNPSGNFVTKKETVTAGRMTKLLPNGVSVDMHMDVSLKDFNEIKKSMDGSISAGESWGSIGGVVEQISGVTIQDQFINELKKRNFQLNLDIFTPSDVASVSSSKVNEFIDKNWETFQTRLLERVFFKDIPIVGGDIQLKEELADSLENIKSTLLKNSQGSYSSGAIGFSLKYNSGGDPEILIYSGDRIISSSRFSKGTNEGVLINDLLESSLYVPNTNLRSGTDFPDSSIPTRYGAGYLNTLYHNILGRGNNPYDSSIPASTLLQVYNLFSKYFVYTSSPTPSPKPDYKDTLLYTPFEF